MVRRRWGDGKGRAGGRRGGKVGAWWWWEGNGRRLDYDAARRVATKTVGLRWFARIMGRGRGNLRVAKTPPLQPAWRGDRCGYAAPIIICVHVGINGNGE